MDLHDRIRLSVLAIAVLGACADGAGAPWASGRSIPPGPENAPELRRVVPTDERAVRQADAPPPAISGGTLLVSSDGTLAFIADPDRDRLSIVALATRTLLHTVAFEPGDEPGRLVQDAAGRVHVALRRGNAVATVDPVTGTLLGRHEACVAPRGIAFDAMNGVLHVACASGDLATLVADGGSVLRRVTLGGDLRDVIVQGDRVLVTRFKSAELLELDARGNVLSTRRAPSSQTLFAESEGTRVVDTLEPHIAWRTVAAADGRLMMVNQLSRSGEIQLPEHGDDAVAPTLGGSPESSPYGGAGDCSGVVQTELTTLDPNGETTTAVRISATLPVDLAISPDGRVAVAQAGLLDPQQPLPTLEVVSDDDNDDGTNPVAGGSAPIGDAGMAAPFARLPVQLHDPRSAPMFDPAGEMPCLPSFDGIDVQGQVVAVAYAPDGNLLAQSREPARLAIYDSFGILNYVDLLGASVYDTGHEIFHRDPGGGVACASCHAEGGDDGHVWLFSDFGARRTQSVSVGLAGTAPFHWQGDMDDLSTLMEEVLVGRMGGVHQSAPRAAALQDWLFALQPPPAPRTGDDPAAARGRALFEGQAQCNSCHSGSKLTDNKTVDVGTGEPLQVPSLVGVAYRAPFIHDGCAPTLRDRFDPSCGGEQHGQTTELTGEQIDDLVAYLESL